MAMNFWAAQQRARSRTKVYLAVFILLTFAVAIGAEWVVRDFNSPDYDERFPFVAVGFLVVTFGSALYHYSAYCAFGGGYVAESMGAYLVEPDTTDFTERQLLNVVEEIALAASLPTPAIYILRADGINAFAAGMTKEKAAICVTTGTLQMLNRDELQGVIAHEFGHIYNGDMRISLNVAAMLMGFFIVLTLAFRMLRFSSLTRSRSDNGRNGNPVMMAALVLMVAGAITYFFGSILKAMISREREYLADACAVQFTRNPNGIANALKKIAGVRTQNMPKEGMAYSHMYFDSPSFFGSIFATHPPILKRIAAIEGLTYIPEEWKKDIAEGAANNKTTQRGP